MDIDEYLKKKKELEKKKELLEVKSELEKKKASPKKEIVIKRKTEITHLPSDQPCGHYHNPPYKHPSDNLQWIFLGLAFFIALLIVGIYVISNFMNQTVSDDSSSKDVDDLQKKLDELEKQLEKNNEEEPEEEINETIEENESTYTGPGPEFDIFILDDHNDEQGIGIFDNNGKIDGKIINIWLESGESAIYKYRLGIKNTESTKIQCKIDETINIDEEFDGEYENTDYNLDLHILELDPGEEEIINDAVIESGSVKGEYEGRCYFCEDKDCNAVYLEAETKKKATFRIRIHSTGFNSNETNDT